MTIDPTTVFILIMLYWNGGGNGQGAMQVAEFSTKERCIQASEQVEAKFSSRWGSGSVYTVCVAK